MAKSNNMKGRASTLDDIVAREAIRDCLARCCRALDRRDRHLLESVFWPDAVDDHIQFKGDAAGYVDWVMPLLAQIDLTSHCLGQILIDVDGDSAAVETYFQAYHRFTTAEPPRDELLCGRYVDRFEQRGGEWRIAFRRVIADWHQHLPSRGGFDNFAAGSIPPANIGVASLQDPSFALLGGAWI